MGRFPDPCLVYLPAATETNVPWDITELLYLDGIFDLGACSHPCNLQGMVSCSVYKSEVLLSIVHIQRHYDCHNTSRISRSSYSELEYVRIVNIWNIVQTLSSLSVFRLATPSLGISLFCKSSFHFSSPLRQTKVTFYSAFYVTSSFGCWYRLCFESSSLLKCLLIQKIWESSYHFPRISLFVTVDKITYFFRGQIIPCPWPTFLFTLGLTSTW